jgi:hypothetical protein
MDARVVHLEDRRMQLRERAELITEATTALTLITAVQESYGRHEMNGFVVLNAVAGAALVIAVLRAVIQMRRHHDAASDGANVVGVFGGAAAVVEGLNRLHSAQFTYGHKHFALGALTVITGLFTGALALFMERMERRRALTISDDGVRLRLNKLRRFSVSWVDIAELRVSAREARLVSASGKARTVPLARLINRDEVSEALVEGFRARGVPVTIEHEGR